MQTSLPRPSDFDWRAFLEQDLWTDTRFLFAAGLTALVFTLACCRIFSRAGFHGALGLLMFVPGVNVVMFFVLAFAPWPAGRELRRLRKLERGVHRADDRYSRAA